MIVVVHEHCVDDEDATFIVDLNALDALDLSDPEVKEYHDAVLAGIKKDCGEKNHTSGGCAFNYNSSEWKAANVKPPCKVDAISEIWEGIK